MVQDPLLDDLDARQHEAVTSPARPLAVVAPAGSGKTRVLTRRIAYRVREGDAAARHVLAVTFTRKAAGEMVDRLARLGVPDGVSAGTFHAIALAQLRRRAAEQGREPPAVMASKARIIAPLLRAGGRTGTVADVAGEIEWAKARMLRPDDYAAAARASARRLPGPADEIAELYARYESEKRRKRGCDFDDLLWWCADAIERDEEFAAGQHWRFRHLFVDEFQDATPLQVRLVRAWLGGRDDLCVVGDAAQAIYAFAGADAAPLSQFAQQFPGGTVINLDRNYRSTPQLVSVSEAVLGAGSGIDRPAVRAVRPPGAAPELTVYDDDAAEAAGVAQRLWESFTHGVPWPRMAVLFRTNAQSAAFEAACTRRGIPFRVTGESRFLDRPAVRALVDELRATEQAAPGRAFADHLADLAADVDDPPGRRGTERAGDAPPAPPEEELRAHRDELLQLGRDYLVADGGPGSLGGFLAWLDVATRGDAGGEPGVELVTFHRAKGLEWQVVHVTGLELGLVPISWATTTAALAEERRLLHVALSRATDELHCSWARTRTGRARRVARERSPWLEWLEAATERVTVPPVDPAAHLAGVRSTLQAARPPARVARRSRRGR